MLSSRHCATGPRPVVDALARVEVPDDGKKTPFCALLSDDGEPTVLTSWPRALAAAPHRMMFFAGMLAAVVSGLWWLLELAGRVAPALAPPAAVAPLWAHSWLMLFGLFGPFILGFLFTTFPRWQSGPEVPRSAYLPVFVLVICSLAAAVAGLLFSSLWFFIGVVLGALAWLAGWIVLLRAMLAAQNVVSHAIVAAGAIGLGAASHFLFAVGIYTGDVTLLHMVLRLTLWASLLPLFFAVCHRMVPFFTQAAVPGYQAHRPLWWLVLATVLFLSHQAMALASLYGWLWLPDGLLFGLTLLAGLRWRPLAARGIPLLWTLYVAYFWLPAGLLLQLVADLGFALTGDWLVGRAPVHALGIGFMSSMLLAMVTRVSLGHSGRRLWMDRFTVLCFFAVQATTVLRIAGELSQARWPAVFMALLLASVGFWVAGLGPWALRYGRMYLQPRVDGRAG